MESGGWSDDFLLKIFQTNPRREWRRAAKLELAARGNPIPGVPLNRSTESKPSSQLTLF